MTSEGIKAINALCKAAVEASFDCCCMDDGGLQCDHCAAVDVYRAAGSPRVPDVPVPDAEALDEAIYQLENAYERDVMEANDPESYDRITPKWDTVAAYLRAMKEDKP